MQVHRRHRRDAHAADHRLPPKRAGIASAGLPPLARSLAAQNAGISLPVAI